MNRMQGEPRQPQASPIVYFSLDCQQRGVGHFFVWSHHPIWRSQPAARHLLIDLNNIFVSENEIDKLIDKLSCLVNDIRSVAFINCQLVSQKILKRKLRLWDAQLLAKTAFFADHQKAESWLAGEAVSC